MAGLYGRIYNIPMPAISISALQDIFSIANSSTHVLAIHSITLAASGVTSAYQQNVRLKRAATFSIGASGTTPAINPQNSGDAAASFTAHINDTSQSASTFVNLVEDVFDVLSGWFYLPTPEDREIWLPSQGLVVDFPNAPAAPTAYQGMLKVEEI